jgi:hypothetical protein
MSRRDLLLLYLAGLLVVSFAAWLTPAPGYMDAEYYTLTGRRLASGAGFTENFIWNYLDDPQALPRPSHTFWMPLTSLLAAAGIWVSGSQSYWAARLGFLLIGALIPPLTAFLGYQLHQNRTLARLAGGFALFSGFFWIYVPAVDGFTLYMLLGGLLALAVPLLFSAPPPAGHFVAFGVGLLIGLMQLTRTDGSLFLVAALALLILRRKVLPVRTSLAGALVLLLGGYLLVIGPWYARNLQEFGALTAPGTARVLWLTSYDELYTYPPGSLTFDHWLSSGWTEITNVRLWALGQNSLTWLAVQSSVFLFPFMLAGAWQARKNRGVQFMALAWLLTISLMTLVFPFPGVRGSFFHAAAAFQPLLWALAPLGLEAFIGWGVRTRGWWVVPARRVFSTGLLIFAMLFTLIVSLPKIQRDAEGLSGAGAEGRYEQVEALLRQERYLPTTPAMVNNPPGYTLVTGRTTLAIPYGSLDQVYAAASRYGAGVLLLEPGTNLPELYQNPELDGRFRLLQVIHEIQVYVIE